MNDRELLEKAAQAAGVFLTPETLVAALPAWEWEDEDKPRHLEGGGMSGTVLVYSYSGELSGTTRQEWNPLTDDGDALRLAVKLKLDLIYPPKSGNVIVCRGRLGARESVDYVDPYAATRRAIVRAAAAMGEAAASRQLA